MLISLLGCGFIGSTLAQGIDGGVVPNAGIVSLFDNNRSVALKCSSLLRAKVHVAASMNELLADESSLVLEAASPAVAKECVPLILDAGKDVMIMSVGAFSDSAFRKKITTVGQKGRIYIPSGAIAGLDGIKAGAIKNLHEVRLTTTKNPEALREAPYIVRKRINLDEIKSAKIIYTGTADEACKLFPANINVAAALSLAGIGFERTRVTIIADPRVTTNIHEIEASGGFWKTESES